MRHKTKSAIENQQSSIGLLYTTTGTDIWRVEGQKKVTVLTVNLRNIETKEIKYIQMGPMDKVEMLGFVAIAMPAVDRRGTPPPVLSRRAKANGGGEVVPTSNKPAAARRFRDDQFQNPPPRRGRPPKIKTEIQTQVTQKDADKRPTIDMALRKQLNKSPYPGVYYKGGKRTTLKWQALINTTRVKWSKCYATPEEARDAMTAKRRKLGLGEVRIHRRQSEKQIANGKKTEVVQGKSRARYECRVCKTRFQNNPRVCPMCNGDVVPVNAAGDDPRASLERSKDKQREMDRHIKFEDTDLNKAV
jgi:hypothetical protein